MNNTEQQLKKIQWVAYTCKNSFHSQAIFNVLDRLYRIAK